MECHNYVLGYIDCCHPGLADYLPLNFMFLLLMLLFSRVQGTVAGIIRGSGRQKIGAIMNFVFYYLIGLPIGISLALLTDLGATGMWTGLCVAVFLTVSSHI